MWEEKEGVLFENLSELVGPSGDGKTGPKAQARSDGWLKFGRGGSDKRHDEHGDAVSSSARALPANLLLTELLSDGEDT